MLELPITIRIPTPQEYNYKPEIFNNLEALKIAKIVEGYVFKEPDEEKRFKFYAEININNSRLINFVFTLSNQLPEKILLIYGFYDRELITTPYKNKSLILDELKKYKLELTQDCNLEFGFLFQSDESVIEIFVTESKYVKFWGCNEVSFRQLMNDFALIEIPDIKFRDEFPKVVEPLINFDSNVISTDLLIEQLNKFFFPKQKGKWKIWK